MRPDRAFQARQPGLVQRAQEPHHQRAGPRLAELRELLPQLLLQGCAAPGRRRRTPGPRAREGLLQPQEPPQGDVLESHEVHEGALALLGACGRGGGTSASGADTGYPSPIAPGSPYLGSGLPGLHCPQGEERHYGDLPLRYLNPLGLSFPISVGGGGVGGDGRASPASAEAPGIEHLLALLRAPCISRRPHRSGAGRGHERALPTPPPHLVPPAPACSGGSPSSWCTGRRGRRSLAR